MLSGGGDTIPLSLLAQLARSGVDPSEAAQLLAMAASIRLENATVTIDLEKASQLAEILSSIDQEKLDIGLGEAAQLVAGIGTAISEATSPSAAEPQGEASNAQPGTGETTQLLEIRGFGDLAAKLYSILRGQAPGELAATATNALEPPHQGSEDRQDNATAARGPPIPEPPPLPSLPGLPGLRDLAVVTVPLALAGVAMLAATRYREVAVLAARVKLARLERRLSLRAARTGADRVEARRMIVEAFSQILRVYETVYAPRAASETHREYAAKLPGDERSRYTPAARVYEKAKFSSEPVDERDVEKLQKLMSEIRRALGTAGGGLAALARLLLGGRK
jgi:hypothetical protein